MPDELPDNAILVARSMSPAALLDYDRTRLRGLVLEEAGAPATSPSSPARSAFPPSSDSRISPRSSSTAMRSSSTARPARSICGRRADVEAAYAEKARCARERQAQYRALRDTPAVTVDGVDDRRCT